MNRWRRYSEIIRENERREKPSIPELPKTYEELNKLLEKKIKILSETSPVDERGGEYHPGGVAVTDLEMECPFCKMKFAGVRHSGCFSHDIDPSVCPNCNFPMNIMKALDLHSKEKK